MTNDTNQEFKVTFEKLKSLKDLTSKELIKAWLHLDLKNGTGFKPSKKKKIWAMIYVAGSGLTHPYLTQDEYKLFKEYIDHLPGEYSLDTFFSKELPEEYNSSSSFEESVAEE